MTMSTMQAPPHAGAPTPSTVPVVQQVMGGAHNQAGLGSLRQLQAKLSERLASKTAVQAQWLKLQCNHMGVLVPIQDVGGLLAVPELIPLPHAQDWVLGVGLIAGEPHLVFDLSAWLANAVSGIHVPGAAPSAPPTLGKNTSAVPAQVCTLGTYLSLKSAFVVTQVWGLCGREDFQFDSIASETAPTFMQRVTLRETTSSLPARASQAANPHVPHTWILFSPAKLMDPNPNEDFFRVEQPF